LIGRSRRARPCAKRRGSGAVSGGEGSPVMSRAFLLRFEIGGEKGLTLRSQFGILRAQLRNEIRKRE